MQSPRVKICGVTSVEDAERAAALGAWAVGMILWRDSERRCRHADALAISAALRRRVQLAGVFVNATLDEVARAAEELRLDLVQLHGAEGPAYCAEVARRTGARVIKAVRVTTAADVRALTAFPTDFHLLDAVQEGGPFDWGLVRSHRGGSATIVAGGLTPDNVAEAIAATSPYAVDVARGVEAEPGRKDPERLAAFFAAVHGVETVHAA